MPDSATPDTAPVVAPSPPARTRDHPIEVKARIELVRLAYRGLKEGTLASGAAALAFALALWLELSTPWLWVWFGFMVLVTAYRLWLAARFQRPEPPPAEFPRWGFRYVVGTTLTASQSR